MQGRLESQRELLAVESTGGQLLGPAVLLLVSQHPPELIPYETFAGLFPSRRCGRACRRLLAATQRD